MPERPNTAHVVISYSPDPTQVGKLTELPVEEAANLVADGRARYATDDDKPAGKEPVNPDSAPQLDQLPQEGPPSGDSAPAKKAAKATTTRASS